MKAVNLFSFLLLVLFSCQSPESHKNKYDLSVSIPDSLSEGITDGRLILMFSKNSDKEPRFEISDGPGTQIAYGKNVENWKKGEKMSFTGDEFGYPLQSMSEVPEGEYYVQVVFHKYETFNLATGHTVKLPMDRGEGQQWNLAPGNLYSTPIKVNLKNEIKTELVLSNKIPAIVGPTDTEWVKHIKMKSKLLSDFWGRDIYIGAHVLLPKDWATKTNVKYPLAIYHGHFPGDFGGFRTTPPDTTIPCTYSQRFKLDCYNRIEQQEAFDFYKIWSGPDFPRVLAIEIQHATPYYDDSYAVNSACQGPYGDAITYELIPYIEKTFRGIGEGWARFLYGGSTGGWEALAAQVFYPGEYNGCFAACPDPIDFRAFTVVDIYKDKNAYYLDSEFKKTPRPGQRDYLGHVSTTLMETNYRELALGDNGRSGQQWDVWEATYSPMNEKGYPKRIWDKLTGEIDSSVAKYWKENYDLSYIMKRDWSKIGDKLRGKVRIYCGDMDNYYLNNAVYLTEEFLKSTSKPYYDGEVDYGDRAEHCWNGDHTQPNAISRLRYH
ncbi:MAG: alpha/beta hydrolase-fold protein, partial [Saprospiraceae bacterium]